MTSHLLQECNTLRRAAGLDRRAALKLFVSGATLALASCGRPNEQVVPYVQIPEREIPGVPLRFATTLSLGGYGRGVVVTSVEGRPIKINGNPRHPASLGSTDIYAEAEVLSLYDPDRSRAPYGGGRIQPWSAFQAALQSQMERESQRQGWGLALLTGRITSPTQIEQLGTLTKAFPQAQWFRYEPVDDDAASAGAQLAFGQVATALPRFADARVVLALDADPLGFGPEQIRYSREITGARQSHDAAESLRLYAVEPTFSLTGALADHRLALQPQLVRNVAFEIARTLGATLPQATLPIDAEKFAKSSAADLIAQRGRAMVLAGPRQPAEVHALCHWINNALAAPINFIAPVDPVAAGHVESLRKLAADVHSGRVQTLILIGANPVYDAPGDLAFGDVVSSAPFSASLSLYRDETAARCTWHLPLSHGLESWSDIRAYDGTASVIQPLIRPLYDTRTAHDLLAMLSGAVISSSFNVVREHWAAANAAAGNFDDWWRQSLQDGLIANSAAKPLTPPPAKLPQIPPAGAAVGGFTVTLAPDPSVYDGRFANNAWLQECPVPFTKQVWGNALHIGEADAHQLGVSDGDVVRLTIDRQIVDAPVLVRPGQAAGTIAATLGHGRAAAGGIGSNVGFSVYQIRQADSPWAIVNIAVHCTGDSQNLLLTQHFFKLEGEADDLQPRFTLAELVKGNLGLSKPSDNPPTLYPPHDYDTYEWAMVIDTPAASAATPASSPARPRTMCRSSALRKSP